MESAREAILLELHLVNHTTEELANRYRLYKHRVMDVRFVCTITRGEHTPMAFNLAPQEYRYRENQYVDGYGQACGLVRPSENVVATDSMPRYEQPWLETPSAKQVGMQQAPNFTLLATNPLPVLNELVDATTSKFAFFVSAHITFGIACVKDNSKEDFPLPLFPTIMAGRFSFLITK